MTQLLHVGVLGMKWGRRKAPAPDTSSDDHKTSRVLKAKKVSDLSNDEIKKLTTRLQLEKQLSDLGKNDISIGKKITLQLMDSMGNQLLNSLSSMAMNHVKNTIQAEIEKKLKKG